jgi:hypothetical protein
MEGLDWCHWTPNTRSSIRALIALPSLVHLAVRYVTFSKIEHFTVLLPPNLKRLTVDWLRISDADADVTQAIDMENDQAPARKPCQLEYLRVYYTPSFNNWLLGEQSDVDISNIHTLDISNEPENISKLVRNMGSSLVHLKMCSLRGSYWFDH